MSLVGLPDFRIYLMISLFMTSGCVSLLDRSLPEPGEYAAAAEGPNKKAQVRYLGQAWWLAREPNLPAPFEITRSNEDGSAHKPPNWKKDFSDFDLTADYMMEIVISTHQTDLNRPIWLSIVTLGIYPIKYHAVVTVAIRLTHNKTGKIKHYFRQESVSYMEAWYKKPNAKYGVNYNPREELSRDITEILYRDIQKDVYAN